MNVAILHFHLNRGGVTQVIQNHLCALASLAESRDIARVAILFGGRQHGWPDRVLAEDAPFSLQLLAIPGLEYDKLPVAEPAKLARELRRSLTHIGFAPDATILHVHNHALGKNASLPGAVAELAADGYRFLLQVHDFAEDFRPDNYRHLARSLHCDDEEMLAATLYPQSDSIHYAVLNGRDRTILRAAGLAEQRLHLLPNPVAEAKPLPEPESTRPRVLKELDLAPSQPLVVYPVRGIRRKNVGEMILLSALDPRDATYAVTLAPRNPAEAGCFHAWREFSIALRLPANFDIGRTGALAYRDILAASDALLTTSVAEGFGMVFLESWLFGRRLFGRDLPDVTSDFVAAGVCYDGLYKQLLIPLDFIGERVFRDELIRDYETARRAYGQPAAGRRELDRAIEGLISSDGVDFARLSSKLQRQVVASVVEDVCLRDAVYDVNPDLEFCFHGDAIGPGENIVHNRKVVRRQYSLEEAGEMLVNIYCMLQNTPIAGRNHKLPRSRSVLQNFLDIRRLHPVRLESCPPPPIFSDA